MTPQQKQDNFKKELLDLLRNYEAEITLEQFSFKYGVEEKIVVNFKFDESLFEENNTGIIPDLVLGKYFSY